mgnify:CR=1 FL=1
MTTASSAVPAAELSAPQARGYHWPTVIALGGMHVLALAAVVPAFFSWSGLIIFAVMVWVTGGLGITLCFHRLLTHRSFKTPKWCEYLLTTLGCLAWQGGPLQWVGMHRLHHKHSDTDHDPHSPEHGFTWAHIVWMLRNDVDGRKGEDAAKDLARDPVMRFLDKYLWLPQLVLSVALLAIGWAVGGWTLGVSWVVWGVVVRTVFVYHTTWFVNSAAHTWGYQTHDTGEGSTNLWWVAILSFGEGWHNNHHAKPRAAAHGRKWYELDPTYWTIQLMGLFGLAKDIKKD